MRTVILLVLLVASTAGAQLVRVSGVAFDSLAMRPLPNAFVSLDSRSTLADSAGAFVFDSVAPGTHRIAMQHDILDSLGLAQISSSIVVRDGMTPIRVATPSSGTMWRRVCPGEQPRDSGFVFGVVRDVKHEPVAGAAVGARWIELQSIAGTVAQKGWRLDTKTIADGSYVMCGVPLGSGVILEATQDTLAYGGIELLLTEDASVRRRDLTVTSVSDAASRGTIRGIVTADGQPLSNVRIETDGLPEVTTAADGQFIIRNVRVGTRQLYVQGIGLRPTSRIVEVTANDTSRVTIGVEKATLLDSVRVVAPTARTRFADQFNDRRQAGIGYFRDSTQLGKYISLEGAFATMPSVAMERPFGGPLTIRIGGMRSRGTQVSGGCQALIFVDRVRSDAEHLNALRPSDLAAVEVYRTGEMPSELAIQFGLNPFSKPCAIVAWTKLGWG